MKLGIMRSATHFSRKATANPPKGLKHSKAEAPILGTAAYLRNGVLGIPPDPSQLRLGYQERAALAYRGNWAGQNSNGLWGQWFKG